MRQRRVLTALAIPLVLAFVAASCGSDDSSSDGTTAGETATEDTTATDEAQPSETVPDVDTSVVENTEEITPGGSVTIGLEAEAVGLRPWEDTTAAGSMTIMRAIYDTLMEDTADGAVAPNLAESLESNEDLTVWTMTLRPDIALHNGTPVTSQTIVDMFALQQTGAAGSAAVASSGLVSVEATDPLTVVYTLSKPNVAFSDVLTNAPLGMVFDPAAATANPVAYSEAPIGTGPFVIKSRDVDNETVVEKNPDYWRTDEQGNQLPYLDSISFRPIPDEGTRLDALLSGTVTAMQSLRQGTIRDARAESGIELVEFQGNNTGGGFFNTLKAPFDDVRVRRALVLMSNQEAVIEALGGTGISLPTTQWFSQDSPWWTQEAADKYLNFDFDAGKASLQEYIDDPARSDGKSPGEKIDVELSCPPDPTLIAAMQVAKQVWDGSGQINVTLTQFDQATHIQNGISDNTAAHCWRFSGEGDPSTNILQGVTDPANNVFNVANVDDPEIAAWAVEAASISDFEARKELYSKIMQKINDEAFLWYSGGTANMIASEPNVKGFNTWTLPSGELGAGIPGAEPRWHEVFIANQ
jgi:peptide/nickel transport system substrate-binding protein